MYYRNQHEFGGISCIKMIDCGWARTAHCSDPLGALYRGKNWRREKCPGPPIANIQIAATAPRCGIIWL